jgi:hypothetical protein
MDKFQMLRTAIKILDRRAGDQNRKAANEARITLMLLRPGKMFIDPADGRIRFSPARRPLRLCASAVKTT